MLGDQDIFISVITQDDRTLAGFVRFELPVLEFLTPNMIGELMGNDDIKQLKGVVSVNGNWDYARPVGAAIVLPSSIDGKAVSAIDASGMLNLEDSNAMSVYGTYQPPHGRPGTMLVRQRAD